MHLGRRREVHETVRGERRGHSTAFAFRGAPLLAAADVDQLVFGFHTVRLASRPKTNQLSANSDRAVCSHLRSSRP